MRADISKQATLEAPSRIRLIIGVVLMLTSLVAFADRVNVAVLLADNVFLTEMGIAGQPVQMGLLMTYFLVAYGLSNFMLGPVCDYLGPRKAMMTAVFLWAVSMVLGGIAASFTLMLAARVILGLGEGLHYPNQGIFVKNWFPPTERGKANAAWQSGVMLGPIIAMPLFAWIITASGWRGGFFTLAAVGLVPIFLLWKYVTDTPRQHKKINQAEIDYIENALKAEAAQKSQVEVASLGQRLSTFITNYRFWVLLIHYICMACIWWGMMTWLPSYLKTARGFSWSAMGMLSALPYVLSLITMWGCGQWADKIGRRAPFAAVGFFVAAAAIYGGAYVPDNMTSAILLSIGVSGIAVTLSGSHSILQSIVPATSVGTATGVFNGIANGISAFSPVAIGYIIGATGSFVGGLLFLVTLAFIGAMAMLVLAVQKY